MAHYAVGDIQGCYYSFLRLLEVIAFDEHRDQLWLVGDLINRGDDSLAVLRWVYAHQEAVHMVLGNHDLHALAVAQGVRPASRGDTLQALLEAPDCQELLTWLRYQPLAYEQQGVLMVHAGLLPQWSCQQALVYAEEATAVLRDDARYPDFLQHMYGNLPDHWQDYYTGMARWRLIVNALTRLRVCDANGRMNLQFKGEGEEIPTGYLPWFDVPNRASRGELVIMGHWSTLGLILRDDLIALDTGCVWGGKLSAVRLEDRAVFQVDPVERTGSEY